MAKEMGIDSPLLMFGDEDEFDNNTQRTSTVRKKSVKRSIRRTTMLPPELSKTLNETFKDRRRSSRLEALDLKFKNPLEVSRIIEIKIYVTLILQIYIPIFKAHASILSLFSAI